MPGFVSDIFDRLTSPKGAALAIPAILLVGAAIAIGQNAGHNAGSKDAGPAPAQVTQAASVPTAPPEPAPGASKAGSFTPDQRREIEAMIKDYLIANPEVMVEIQTALESKMEKVQAEKMQVALKDSAGELFRSPGSPVAGNAKGDVTVVEFFDYNCGYCKKAFGDLAAAVDKDSKIKLVLKEFPILSKGSEEAAKVALAAKMQGKYWEFHRAMLEAQGQANEASALKVAEKVGLDMGRIKKDLGSAEVKKEIEDTRKLAQKMGIQGTPHFLVGDKVIAGAPEGLTELIAEKVAEIRKSGCGVC